MKKVFIVGLGLMGASYAKGLAGRYEVYGYDIDEQVRKRALDEKIVISTNLNDISKCEIVILSLYPNDNIKFLAKHKILLKQGSLLTDLSGIKSKMIESIVEMIPEGINYTSHHPMAGGERSGIEFASQKIFKNKNFIIIPTIKTGSDDYKILMEIAIELGFANIRKLSISEHDKYIANISHLTHLIAPALLLSDDFEEIKDLVGPSFIEMTRVANINIELWQELLISNKEYILESLNKFISNLNDLAIAIENDNKDELSKLLKIAKERRDSLD